MTRGGCSAVSAETPPRVVVTEPGSGAADPIEHGRVLSGIRGLRLHVREVRSKFKYGGNADDAHRAEVVPPAHRARRAG
jgi:hypothetical protein